MARTNNGNEAKTIRCAIYTRKSTDEGLNQEFNSLDAQREAGEAYIALASRGPHPTPAPNFPAVSFSGFGSLAFSIACLDTR